MNWAPDEAIVDEIERALADWGQGDVLTFVSECRYADSAKPLSEAAQSVRDDGLSLLVIDGTLAVVVSQTCDLVRSPAKAPFALLAPVDRIADADYLTMASRGRVPKLVPLPWLGPDLFGDLARIFTVEKSVLLLCERVSGTQSDTDRQLLSLRIGTFFSRPAFPDDFVDSMHRLRQKFQRRSKPEAEPGEESARALIYEIRISIEGNWDDDDLPVHVMFVLESEADRARVPREIWESSLEKWQELIDSAASRFRVTTEIVSLEALSASEYLHSDWFDTVVDDSLAAGRRS